MVKSRACLGKVKVVKQFILDLGLDFAEPYLVKKGPNTRDKVSI